MLVLPSGLMVGLWGRGGIEPAPAAPAGGSELGFAVGGPTLIDVIRAD